jgi:hypothetical protein
MNKRLLAIWMMLVFLVIGLGGCLIFVGGPCSYESYHGKATIISITRLDNVSTEHGYRWPDRYEVIFIFELNEGQIIREDQMRLYETIKGKQQEFRLVNSWYPNKEYLDKYGIREQAVFNCTLQLITEGTCSPYIFDFDDVDESDYLA